jgi:hypothetical protein
MYQKRVKKQHADSDAAPGKPGRRICFMETWLN